MVDASLKCDIYSLPRANCIVCDTRNEVRIIWKPQNRVAPNPDRVYLVSLFNGSYRMELWNVDTACIKFKERGITGR